MFSILKKPITPIRAGFMISFIILSVIVIMVITSVIAVLSLNSISSLSTINLLSIQKNKEIKQLDNIINKDRELHSNVRDYVITRDSSYIRNFASDREVIRGLLNNYSDSATGTMIVRSEINRLGSLINRKIAFNLNILKLYKYGGRDIALDFIETGKASILNDSIELLTLNIKEIENKELETSVGRYNGAAHQTRQTIIAASTLLILLGLLFMITTISNVRQRAKIISELEAAKGDSEKAATLKDQFVSNMSHEIRTPLNSIIGFTNLLNATRLNTEQYDFVDTIKNASENLLRIVNDILDFSKIQAGMMQGHQHPFSISEQIKIIEKLFEQSNNKSNLRISYFIDTIMPEICIGDALRLNQILVNLVSNAIKFTHHGEIAIAVLVTKISADNVTLEFSVSDTGIGIPSERISKIFDRFEQINSASNRKTGGTGLGLSITKSLIELEGGSISVTSTENKGSAFIFTLSYALPVADTAPLRYDDGAGQNQKIFLPLQGRVLIVEDNPLNQKLIGLLLKKWQVEYELAQNGLEACEKLSHKTYSLILMDIQMPEMDGYAATAIIREKMNISTPIVALTAYSIDHDKVDFLKYGMNAYVTKPFREADLYNALTKYLDTKENNPDRQTISDESKDFSQSKLQEIENMYNGDRAYVREMAEMFVSQITVEIQNLDAAYIAKDYKNMAAIAHSMKSTVSYMGLNMDLYETLSRLEQSSGISSSEAITADINHIKMISRRTIMLIETELPSYIA